MLVMAAGRGTRMRSSLPKVLHPVCGKPMVEWVIDSAREAGADEVVCVTRPGDGVAEGLPDAVTVAEQREGEGTGAAVLAARRAAGDEGTVVVLSGDHPLLSADLVGADGLHASRACGGRHAADHRGARPDGLRPDRPGRRTGRWRGSWRPSTPRGVPAEELAIREINVGTYAFAADQLWTALDEVGTEQAARSISPAPWRCSGARIARGLPRDTRRAAARWA